MHDRGIQPARKLHQLGMRTGTTRPGKDGRFAASIENLCKDFEFFVRRADSRLGIRKVYPGLQVSRVLKRDIARQSDNGDTATGDGCLYCDLKRTGHLIWP
jgi:hypothetical protein